MGSALFLTIMVEAIVIEGDIGRMNTVFKFYLQAWTFFAISSAVALGWIIEEIDLWKNNWKKIFYGGLLLTLGLITLFPNIRNCCQDT